MVAQTLKLPNAESATAWSGLLTSYHMLCLIWTEMCFKWETHTEFSRVWVCARVHVTYWNILWYLVCSGGGGGCGVEPPWTHWPPFPVPCPTFWCNSGSHVPGVWNQRTLTSEIHNLPRISCVTLDDLPKLLFLHILWVLVVLCSMWYLSSSTKGGTFTPAVVAWSPLDHPGSPSLSFSGDKNGAWASLLAQW